MIPNLSSGLLVMAGAIIGSLTTAAGMVYTARTEKRRLAHEVRGRINAQAIEVFREYLAACKEVERFAEEREAGGHVTGSDVRGFTTPMWLRYQEAQVFCPPPIVDAAWNFTDRLNQAAWGNYEESVTAYLWEARRQLSDAARPVFQELIE